MFLISNLVSIVILTLIAGSILYFYFNSSNNFLIMFIPSNLDKSLS